MDSDATMLSVANILAVTVLLDQKQRDLEMVEFCHSIMTINQRLRPGVILPRQKILAWFETHKAVIAKSLAEDSDDSYKKSLLNEIKDPALRRQTLAAIFSISICDYELRDEEADFIKIALDIWKTGLPNVDDVELIAG